MLGIFLRFIQGVTTLGERTIPAPAGISPEMLEVVKERQIPPIIPAPETMQEWLKLQAAFGQTGRRTRASGRSTTTWHTKYRKSLVFVPMCSSRRISTNVGKATSLSIPMAVHGSFGGGDSALREAVWVASGLGVQVISVDYRRPPLHPFPAAVEDAVAVWQAVVKITILVGSRFLVLRLAGI